MRTCVYVTGTLHLLSAQGSKDNWKIQGRGEKLRNVAWKSRGGVNVAWISRGGVRNVAWKCRGGVRDVAWKSMRKVRSAA